MNTNVKRTTFLTGFRIALWIQFLILAACIIVSAAVYNDPHSSSHGDFWSVFQFGFITYSVFLLLCILIVIQRIKMDSAGRKFLCANIHTLHRWQEIDVDKIQAIEWIPASKRMKAGVDTLQLIALHPKKDGSEQVCDVMDSRVAPVFSERPSALFVAIVDFVKTYNPKATLPPEFISPQD